MKKTIMIICIGLSFIACQNTKEIKPSVDNATLTKEVTESEKKLFSLSKEGKMNEAFAMHNDNAAYQNIVNGSIRTHSQMDSVIKNWANKKIKALEYDVSKRDFLIIDNTNVLETAEATRKLISTTDSVIKSYPLVMSILWSKDNTNWKVAYLHSSNNEDK
jgi:hypothetical protein